MTVFKYMGYLIDGCRAAQPLIFIVGMHQLQVGTS